MSTLKTTQIQHPDASTPAITLAADGTADIETGEWQIWTPTCGNITVGNGVIDGSYAQIGKTVTCRFNFRLGSTSSVSGTPDLIPPIPMSGNMAGMAWVGSINDNGTATYALYVINQGGSLRLYALNSSTNYLQYAPISATVPMTWANLDWMRFVATYEAA